MTLGIGQWVGRSTAILVASGLLVLAAPWSAASEPAARPPAGGDGDAESGALHSPAQPPAEPRRDPVPGDLGEVGVTEHLDAQLPLDLEFRDERDRPVRLGDYFEGEKPVVLSLVYYRCPMLCNLILDGVTEAVADLGWIPGEEFEMVAVSIDPIETHTLATIKKQSYVEKLGEPEAAEGWHFLVGEAPEIRDLADTVGFGYEYVESRNEWAHAAVTFIITPDGRVSRYLYGVVIEPKTLRMALLEAADGKIGTVVDRFLMYCYHYDAAEGKYSLAARNLMKLGGVVTLLVLGGALLVFWRRELAKRPSHPEPEGSRS